MGESPGKGVAKNFLSRGMGVSKSTLLLLSNTFNAGGSIKFLLFISTEVIILKTVFLRQLPINTACASGEIGKTQYFVIKKSYLKKGKRTVT